jgi:hypothetical protein
MAAQDLERLELPLPDRPSRPGLGQVARIEDTIAERRATALNDGKPVVAFEVVRTRGAGRSPSPRAWPRRWPNCRPPTRRSASSA